MVTAESPRNIGGGPGSFLLIYIDPRKKRSNIDDSRKMDLGLVQNGGHMLLMDKMPKETPNFC